MIPSRRRTAKGDVNMSMMSEFKDFAMKGSVVDMAVGVVIGGAFKSIVTSFTNDILMPPVGLLLGGVDFSALSLTIKEAAGEAEAVSINYGVFINSVIDFIIIAFAIFLVVKAMNHAMEMSKKQEEEAPEAPPEPTKEEVLLTEIRDAIRTR
jgi:large conductance mechanosensitive channel